MTEELNIYKEKMQKTVDGLAENFQSIRAGRANPHVLDKIKVDYYGTPTPIQQVGNISVPEARIILIQPWEKALIKEIEKAIYASNLGITPQNDGKSLRLSFPPLTEERRRELTRQVSKMGEDAKVNIRNVRREGVDAARDMKKSGEMTEDEEKQSEKLMQDLTDRMVKEIERITSEKEEEIMSI